MQGILTSKMYYSSSLKRSKRIYDNLNQLDERASDSQKSAGTPPEGLSPKKSGTFSNFLQYFMVQEKVQDQYQSDRKSGISRQVMSLPERSQPITIPSSKSSSNQHSKRNLQFEIEGLQYDEGMPNGKVINDLMVECTQVLGKEVFVFYYPVEIGDFSLNLWSKDQKVFSLSIYENGQAVSLADARIRDFLPSTNKPEFNLSQIQNLIYNMRCVCCRSPLRSSL